MSVMTPVAFMIVLLIIVFLLVLSLQSARQNNDQHARNRASLLYESNELNRLLKVKEKL